MVVAEAPDDETAVKLSLALGARGNVRIETCRAFADEEYRRIVAGLPAVKQTRSPSTAAAPSPVD